MTAKVSETRLPGIGMRYTLRCSDGERLSVVLRNDGGSELYTWDDRKREGDTPSSTIDLDVEETRQLTAILAGAYERPQVVEDLEYAKGELMISWVPVPDGSAAIGRSLGDLAFRERAGITVSAIVREPAPVIGAQPEDVLQAGDTLVAVGTRGAFPAFRALLADSSG